jgi:hypothetical protein
MIFIYLSVVFFLIGLSLWMAGAALHKNAAHLEKKQRKKRQQKALFLGTIAKIILIIASLLCVTGIMMIQGVKIS